MHTGTVSGLWYCRRSWRLWIDFRWNFVYIWMSYICSNKLDVQETNVCLAQFDGMWNNLSRCMGLGYWSVALFPQPNKEIQGDGAGTCCVTNHQVNTPTPKRWLKFSTMILSLSKVYYVSSNVKCLQFCATLYIFEDKGAETKMIVKGQKSNNDTRYFSKTKYVDTKNQLADILTKGNFTRDEENHLLHLVNISIFGSGSCPQTMSQRMQQGTGEERIVAKSKPTLNLVSLYTHYVSHAHFSDTFSLRGVQTSRTRMAQGGRSAHVTVSPSHPLPSSCFIRLPLLFPDGHFETTFPTLTSAPSLPNWSRSESAGQAHFRTSGGEFWLPGRPHALHKLWAQRVRQDYFNRRRHDAHGRSELR